jgi:cbb3-type cytochrome oxidase subunit 3
MWVVAIEAALALGLFLFLIWWTMFSGKKKKDDENKD